MPSQLVNPINRPKVHKPEPTEFTGPLFLVGMPRSGTKLLRDLLNRHPRIAIPEAETEFLPWLAHRADRGSNLADRSEFERVYQHLERQAFFNYRSEAGRPIRINEWYASCARFDAAGVFEALVRLDVDAGQNSGKIWGDKSPSYIDDLGLISRLYPEARVLHIVRDVRDYCISMNRAWGKDMRRAAHRWAAGVTLARREGAHLGPRYAEVRYEDLLSEPEAELRRICTFLTVDFHTEMLTLARPAERHGDTRGAFHVVADNFGKFGKQMDQSTLADIEQIATQAMQEFGYEPVSKAPPRRLWMPVRLRLAQLHDAIQLLNHREENQSILDALIFHLRYFLTTRA